MASSWILVGRRASCLQRKWKLPLSAVGCTQPIRAASSSAFTSEVEFTLSEYRDNPDLGFNKGNEFCMLTLRHPAFDTATSSSSRKAIFDAKEKEHDKYVDDQFDRLDVPGSGILEGSTLKAALTEIGQRPDDYTVAGILQRHAVKAAGQICREEYPAVVREVWGKRRAITFDSRLADLHRSVQGHAPLEGTRAVVWIGRESPIHWVLRLVKHTWPYAVRRVVIVQSVAPNPDLDPALMEVCFQWVTRDQFDGLMVAKELAKRSSEKPSTTEGGLAIRLDPYEPGAPSVYVPLRGLPENGTEGLMANFWGRLPFGLST